MMFMGVMMLIVLPLFLVISARMVAASEFGKSVGGKILQGIFYAFAGLSVIGLITLIVQMVT